MKQTYKSKIKEYIRKHPAKLTIVGLILTMIVSLGIYIYFDLKDFYDSVYNDGTDMVITELGDEFEISYSTAYWREHRTDYYVFAENGSSSVANWTDYYQDYIRPEVDILINNEKVRCYAFERYSIVYRIKDEPFKGFDMTNEFLIDYHQDQEVIEVVKGIITNNDWFYFDLFAEYLIDNKDADTIELVIRYSEGSIEDEEVKVKSTSEFNKEYIIEFSHKLVEKYNLLNE